MSLLLSLQWAVMDTLTLVRRNLLHYTRLPQLVVFSTIQPIMFMLLFTYVFGGAIKHNAADYVTFLLPGIIVQTIVFGSLQTGISLADDLSKGVMDRFRSLPMSQAAVLGARTLTDIVRNIFVVSIMVLIGFIIGFRIEHGVIQFFLGIMLALLFGFAFSWISATIGLVVRSVETAQVAGFIWIFPLVFASSIFVPIETMPDWLRAFAERSPITLTVNTARGLILGGPVRESLWSSLAWIIGLLVIFVPLAVYRYKKSTT